MLFIFSSLTRRIYLRTKSLHLGRARRGARHAHPGARMADEVVTRIEVPMGREGECGGEETSRPELYNILLSAVFNVSPMAKWYWRQTHVACRTFESYDGHFFFFARAPINPCD